MSKKAKVAIIIGAGPAGLTAAYEFLHRTDIKPIVFEMSDDIGGLAKTVNYKGNRIDIGGHRFFSKSDRVMEWWNNILPLQGRPAAEDSIVDITYHNRTRPVELNSNGPDPEKEDKVMLIRNRLSRVFFLRKFFNYPISFNFDTINNLGIVRMIRIGFSYAKARLSPLREEKSLEDFFINRFGSELYLTFFKDYTEKVWGVACNKIKPEWGAQRVKGLSLTKTVLHALRKPFSTDHSVSQKGVETSLIDRFLYPKYGPGQIWEEVARIVIDKGGELHKNHRVVGLKYDRSRICQITVRDEKTGQVKTLAGDYFFSTMPVKELINNIEGPVPEAVKEIANGLIYRDFITVGLLLKKLRVKNQTKIKTAGNIIPDNWIYIQEPEVKIGRLQIFNNWSPYLVKDPDTIWIGCEYFCNEGDELWSKSDSDFISLAIDELSEIEIIDKNDVLDSTLIRMKNTYPAYFGSYDNFHVVRDFTDKIENLFLVGRNGMHRYNNQDHSMLTAMEAVGNIIKGVKTRDNIWAVNPEGDYIEDRVTSVEKLTQGLLQRDEEEFTSVDPESARRTEVTYPAHPQPE
jgi:protoporphyrinogen oxidase